MLLDLKIIPRGGTRIDRTYPAASFEPAEDFAVASPVDLGFDVTKAEDRYRLKGRVATSIRLTCSRCLEPFTWLIDAAFDLRYLPFAANTGEGELEVEEDDLTTAFYREQTIDLGQLMREQFYLALPMKPLCGEDCRGLCPVCGLNLNRSTCECVSQWEDPRLEPLRRLRVDGGRS